MPMNAKLATHDLWLSGVFGKDVYRIALDSSASLDESLKKEVKALQTKAVFLYAKIATTDMAGIKFLEDLSFNLVDTNILLEKQAEVDLKLTGRNEVRFARDEDEDLISEVARNSFQFSRFHQDPKTPKVIADKIKEEWARNFFHGKRGSHMIAGLVDGKIKGFLQLLNDNRGNFIIDLIAAHPSARNRNLATDMIAFAQLHCPGIKTFLVGTQVANVVSLRLYEKLGFRIKDSHYVFHYHSDL